MKRNLPRSLTRWLCGFLAAGIVALQAAPQSDEGTRLTAIRFWSMSDFTRIAVEVTGDFHFKADRLHTPERVFFDLFGTRPELPGENSRTMAVIPVGDQFLRRIRVAQPQPGATRVVFDLEGAIEFSTSQLANP